MNDLRPLIRHTPPLRRWAAHPLVPLLLLTAGTMLAATYGHVLTWVLAGALAGYTLSGSV
jgi:hypothetical protein